MSQFRRDTGTILDGEPTDELVQTITTAVADAEGVETWDLPPLYDAVDPDALHSLIESHESRDDQSPLHVTFSYHGYDVTVTEDRTVDLRA